jgi:hypothetical protein
VRAPDKATGSATVTIRALVPASDVADAVIEVPVASPR